MWILASQFEAIEAGVRIMVRETVASRLAREWGMTVESLSAPLRDAFPVAEAHGFLQEDDLIGFLRLARVHGIDFPTQRWAQPFFYKRPLDYPSSTLIYLRALAPHTGRHV